MNDRVDACVGAAIAALGICESLIVSLIDRGLLDRSEVDEICETALSAKRAPLMDGGDRKYEGFTEADIERAAALIHRMQRGTDALRQEPRT